MVTWTGRERKGGIDVCVWTFQVRVHPPMQERQETRILSVGPEDPLEKGRATHSCVPAWRIPWTEEPIGIECMRPQRVRND